MVSMVFTLKKDSSSNSARNGLIEGKHDWKPWGRAGHCEPSLLYLSSALVSSNVFHERVGFGCVWAWGPIFPRRCSCFCYWVRNSTSRKNIKQMGGLTLVSFLLASSNAALFLVCCLLAGLPRAPARYHLPNKCRQAQR